MFCKPATRCPSRGLAESRCAEVRTEFKRISPNIHDPPDLREAPMAAEGKDAGGRRKDEAEESRQNAGFVKLQTEH